MGSLSLAFVSSRWLSVGSRYLHDLTQAVRRASSGLFLHNGPDLAASIAFWAFFSSFPLLLGLIFVVDLMLETPRAQGQVLEIFASQLPGSQELVRTNISSVLEENKTLGWLSCLSLAWSGSAIFGAVGRSLHRSWQVPITHPLWRTRLRSLALSGTVGLIFLAALVLTSSAQVLVNLPFTALARLGLDDTLGTLDGGEAFFAALAARGASLIVTFGAFALIYKWTPQVKIRWPWVLPGALVAAILFAASREIFLIYLERFANFQAVYGSLSSVIVLMLWMYVSALILLFGAELTAAYRPELGQSRLEPPESAS